MDVGSYSAFSLSAKSMIMNLFSSALRMKWYIARIQGPSPLGFYTAWPLDGSCARHKISKCSGDIIKQVECFFRHVWYRVLSVWFPVGSKQHVGPTPWKHGLMVDLLSFDRPVPSDKLGNFIANLSWNASFTYIALSRTGYEIPTFTLLFYSITPPWTVSPCSQSG